MRYWLALQHWPAQHHQERVSLVSYFEIPNCEVVDSVDKLSLPRAKNIYRALERNSDFFIIEVIHSHPDDKIFFEGFIIDVECDEVPPNNPFNLLYRERLAILVHKDDQRLVEVLALRKSFPKLMHQNQVEVGSPKSLCLYFEPVNSVKRTWTAERFLRRIQWWLEKSAQGQLHASDQPVEQLFFTPMHELVLPWNFDELVGAKDSEFVIWGKEGRPNKALTFFIEPKSAKHKEIKVKPQLIHITLPLSKQDGIEDLPRNLSQLIEVLITRGIDFVAILNDKLRTLVGDGLSVNVVNENEICVVLLDIPISRGEGKSVEKINRYAFFTNSSLINLGVTLDSIFLDKEQRKYFSSEGVLGARSIDQKDLGNINLDWMDVLYTNRLHDFRRQSGTLDKGPKGVFVGAGALGSCVLNIWSRSGWGAWTVVDNDHVKPHNLSRHTAYHFNIGENKAEVQCMQHDLIVSGAGTMNSVVVDAMNLADSRLSESLSTADVVIDCTTTLEYPRLISSHESLPRHISIFITPNGCNTVLLAEDINRKVTLRTLEAQYYRGVILNEWGKHHLKGNLGSFWSGASCRDISVVLPYSSLTFSASILSQQIPLVWKDSDAQIKVWSRDDKTCQTEMFSLSVCNEQEFTFGEFRLFIDDGLVAQLKRLREQNLPNETGGVLLGYYDLDFKLLVIVTVLTAPLDSRGTPISFDRGVEGVIDAVNEAARRTAGIVQYVGEWHSHPAGHSAEPSGDDLVQIAVLAKGMSDDGLPAVQLIVGEDEICILQAQM